MIPSLAGHQKGQPSNSWGGSRIPYRRGADLPGEPTYNFAKFSPQKCMKLRNVWVVGGRRAPGTPPLDPPLNLTSKHDHQYKLILIVFVNASSRIPFKLRYATQKRRNSYTMHKPFGHVLSKFMTYCDSFTLIEAKNRAGKPFPCDMREL